MSGGPVFATRWDFLFAQVLIGVDRSTGVFSGSEPVPGRQLVCVWTSKARADDALHSESWDVRKISVRRLLAMLPAGIGVQVDPGDPSGMTASADYTAQVKRYLEPFPAGTTLRRTAWDGLDASVCNALATAGAGHVRTLYAFGYTVDDSPTLGCLAYVAEDDTAGEVLEAALDASTSLAALGVPTVHLVALADVPEVLRAELDDADVVRPARRPTFWRR
ncbi:hypothetical protein [Aeromicrobium chenweiae]|uniref:Uncharacterized protein n=1 Tax=Aeromicrobium chenweiae TaxID=2079793 RepID=A0A2S0WNF6_9ACTN|nr:hypothetical protein [Aeromicrobium chenweiae]AWB92865.1 hypothetical protein C3E78_11985 [Aeromicrobium chenweiae]TGN33860.1 hypothetical protein E4L97_02035 [Aeromicrobium chenweiae]